MMVSGKVKGQHVLLWSVCVACLLPAVVNAHCAKLEFSTGTTDKAGETTVIRVPENQRAKVPFNLHTTACGDIRPEQFTVSISRKDPNHVFVDLCKQQLNGSSSYGTENCDIQRENGDYVWDRIVRRGDTAQWRWRATYGTAEASHTIHLDVTYPLVIVRISKRSSSLAAEPGSSVNLVCSYEKGNPDVSPFIKNYQGRKLEVHHDKPGEVRHTANDVSCNDMGVFSCEAPGAVKNQTMPLLVKCPLRFWNKTATPKKFVLDLQKNATLDFPVRSHTNKFSACWLSLWGDHAKSSHKPVNCLSYIKAMNPPPFMTLVLAVLAVPNVTVVHLGQWNLTVSNDAGSDHVLFEITSATASGPVVLSQPSGATYVPLHIASSTTRGPFYLPDTTTKQTNDDDDNGTAGVVFASIFVVIILILVISIIAFFLTRRYRRKMDLPCHLCTRRHYCETNEQSPPYPDWNVYVIPDAARIGNRSGAAGGEVTGNHLNEGLQIALPRLRGS